MESGELKCSPLLVCYNLRNKSEYLEEVKTMRDDWRPKAKTSARAIRTVCDRRGVLWHYDHNEGKWVEGRWTVKAKLKAVKNN